MFAETFAVIREDFPGLYRLFAALSASKTYQIIKRFSEMAMARETGGVISAEIALRPFARRPAGVELAGCGEESETLSQDTTPPLGTRGTGEG